jgi:hypothetical protein
MKNFSEIAWYQENPEQENFVYEMYIHNAWIGTIMFDNQFFKTVFQNCAYSYKSKAKSDFYKNNWLLRSFLSLFNINYFLTEDQMRD